MRTVFVLPNLGAEMVPEVRPAALIGIGTVLCLPLTLGVAPLSGLLVDACLTLADGHAERVAALHMIEPRADRPTAITLGADKAYDAEDFVNELRSMNVTPHIAQNTSGRSSTIDGRTTRHAGYAVSQRIRKRIEEAFGWIKTIAGQEKSRFRGRDRVGWAFTFAAAAYNLVRLPKLIAGAG